MWYSQSNGLSGQAWAQFMINQSTSLISSKLTEFMSIVCITVGKLIASSGVHVVVIIHQNPMIWSYNMCDHLIELCRGEVSDKWPGHILLRRNMKHINICICYEHSFERCRVRLYMNLLLNACKIPFIHWTLSMICVAYHQSSSKIMSLAYATSLAPRV